MSVKRVNENLNRRDFILAAAATAAAAAGLAPGSLRGADTKFHPIPASTLPTRVFGKTGAKIPLLTFGSGSRWMMYEEEEGLRVINEAIDSGITYLDTAHNYGSGKSEEWIGKLMPERRKQVLIQTKIADRDPDGFQQKLELSLKRLKVDYLDMCLIHSLEQDDDLEALEKGVIDRLYKAKEQGLTRWIGISSHTSGATLAKFLRRHKVDAIQCGLNVATNGPHDMGFEELVLPLAVEQGSGITAMKVMGQDMIANKYEAYGYDTCLRYSLSLPVTAATVGMPKPEHLKKNLELVRNFKPFSPEEMQALKKKAAGEIQSSFIEHMRGHSDFA